MKNHILSDYHMHTAFSSDSDTPMEEMIEESIRQGLRTICFTEHLDMDYPKNLQLDFSLDTPAYFQKIMDCRERYVNQIEIRFGVELGLQPHLGNRLQDYVKQYPFDFIIGSSHLVHGHDPYFPGFFSHRAEEACFREYFETILENLSAFDDVDTYGHIDYIVRYGPDQNRYYSYEKYQDILDEILRTLIDKNIGLEVNTGGFKYGLGHPNPCEEILTRYRELGGELITIGSDAHAPQHIAYDFSRLPSLLNACGFDHYFIFRERKPTAIKL